MSDREISTGDLLDTLAALDPIQRHEVAEALRKIAETFAEMSDGKTATWSVQKTKPWSSHTLAALRRSSAWCVLCFCSMATTAGDNGTVRRERSVFGVDVTNLFPTRAMVAATLSVPALRSRCSQRNASASPRRSPVLAMRTSAGWYRIPSAAFRTLAASAADRCLVS